ncbi:MAG: Gfo/Idh/MocA family oxidoreductase [Chloroflexota bacterium]
MIRFGVIGTGWRTLHFIRIAAARPDLFTVVGVVTRDVERAKSQFTGYNVPLFGSVDEMLAQKPLYVITSVPWDVNPVMLTQLAGAGVPALSETPPATTIEDMNALYQLVQNGAKIAVAEQFHLQPHHAARLAFIETGKIGTVSQAQYSVGHGYHGISLIRRTLGVMFENATITAHKFDSPVVSSPDRDGDPEHEEITTSTQLIAHMNFGDKLGILDFTGDQYFSYIRGQRILIRGERGEIINDTAVYLQDHTTPIHVTFRREDMGQRGNHQGHHLKGIQVGEQWLYKNPLAPARLTDEEIAIGHAMLKMADYADGGDPFYSLAEACQDRYLDMVTWQAAESGQPITIETQLWAQ